MSKTVKKTFIVKRRVYRKQQTTVVIELPESEANKADWKTLAYNATDSIPDEEWTDCESEITGWNCRETT